MRRHWEWPGPVVVLTGLRCAYLHSTAPLSTLFELAAEAVGARSWATLVGRHPLAVPCLDQERTWL